MQAARSKERPRTGRGRVAIATALAVALGLTVIALGAGRPASALSATASDVIVAGSAATGCRTLSIPDEVSTNQPTAEEAEAIEAFASAARTVLECVRPEVERLERQTAEDPPIAGVNLADLDAERQRLGDQAAAATRAVDALLAVDDDAAANARVAAIKLLISDYTKEIKEIEDTHLPQINGELFKAISKKAVIDTRIQDLVAARRRLRTNDLRIAFGDCGAPGDPDGQCVIATGPGGNTTAPSLMALFRPTMYAELKAEYYRLKDSIGSQLDKNLADRKAAQAVIDFWAAKRQLYVKRVADLRALISQLEAELATLEPKVRGRAP